MFVYAGIDEAGYGPMFGPLIIGCTVFALPQDQANDLGPAMWERLSRVVCRNLIKRRGRIAINDSKKLHTPATGLKHLERGVLSFAALALKKPQHVGQWLDCLGETHHHKLQHLPWYHANHERPWQPLPVTCTAGEITVARAMLAQSAKRAGIELLDMGAAVVFEDRFNQMVSATRSKAATSFTFVAKHLRAIWEAYGQHRPTVIVDRQSGRRHYRELLSMAFPEAHLKIKDESDHASAYEITTAQRGMTVHFEVDADGRHMPTALASMVSKYTRELLMARFQQWFQQRAPQIKPTAGYARDAKRFWQQIEPMLDDLAIEPLALRRIS